MIGQPRDAKEVSVTEMFMFFAVPDPDLGIRGRGGGAVIQTLRKEWGGGGRQSPKKFFVWSKNKGR